MNLRKQFERLHPVPEGALVDLETGLYVIDSTSFDDSVIEDRYNALWQGFQSGHAAGVERAADLLDDAAASESFDRTKIVTARMFAAAIRAAKEQK